jgi:hypothetical protein
VYALSWRELNLDLFGMMLVEMLVHVLLEAQIFSIVLCPSYHQNFSSFWLKDNVLLLKKKGGYYPVLSNFSFWEWMPLVVQNYPLFWHICSEEEGRCSVTWILSVICDVECGLSMAGEVVHWSSTKKILRRWTITFYYTVKITVTYLCHV